MISTSDVLSSPTSRYLLVMFSVVLPHECSSMRARWPMHLERGVQNPVKTSTGGRESREAGEEERGAVERVRGEKQRSKTARRRDRWSR